jgi:dimethylglycine dehydrogenase
MEEHARVVVIGGGVTGCSILYHLARAGWQDIMLLERQELTSGSSWHAAGGIFTVTRPNAVAAVHKYTIEIYPELEKESGQSCGFHDTGGLNLCRSEAEIEYFTAMQGAVRRLGIESEFISNDEVRRRAPIVNTDLIAGALWEEQGGHVDPASATQAFAAAARKLGATIHRHCPVIETIPLPDGRWQVVTANGTVNADVVVNAAGLWGREVAALAGISLPLLPVEHHYLVTENVPEIEALALELPQINDGEINCYARQEGQGLLLGAYETPCLHWAEAGTPLDFGHELLPDDLGRMEWHFEKSVEVMPCLATAGVKRVINGPMIFSPDLGPLLGPHPELANYFCANGVMTGFNQGAGIGKLMAEWIIEGEPSFDIFCWDVARYGPWAGRTYTRELTAYFYEHRSDRVYPYQEFEVGRPVMTTAVHDRLEAANAVFGSSFGLEHPLWFASDKASARDDLSLTRPNWVEPVADECRAVRHAAGLFEFSALAKLKISGPGAEDWLNFLMANRMPLTVGRIVLSPMLNPHGRLIGDFSITRLGEQEFLLLSADVMQLAYLRHFARHLPADGVRVENMSEDLAALHLAGPAAQEILGHLAEDDVSSDGLGFMRARRMTLGRVPDVTVLRISYTGETGYEIYCPPLMQRTLFDQIVEAGKPHDLTLVGTRALMMTRLEKNFPAWGLELSSDYTAAEAGLEQFVCLDKGDFVGRTAAIELAGPARREVRGCFTVDSGGIMVWGDEAVYCAGQRVGYVSSGGYGAEVDRMIALGYVTPQAFDPGAAFEIEILGQHYPAQLHAAPLYDPQGGRMRG